MSEKSPPEQIESTGIATVLTREVMPLSPKWQLITLKEGQPAADSYFAELRIQQAKREAEAAAKFEAELWQAEAAPHTGADSRDEWKTDPGLSKLEKQQRAISAVIESSKFNPQEIPDGEKTRTIQRVCENEHAALFKGATSFDRAWKLGVKSGLWKMEHYESYARRGSN